MPHGVASENSGASDDEFSSRRSVSRPLTRRELQFACLYADGYSHKAIARELHVTLANVEGTIHRAKVQYRNAGHDVHTKSDTRQRLVAGDLLPAVQGGYKELIDRDSSPPRKPTTTMQRPASSIPADHGQPGPPVQISRSYHPDSDACVLSRSGFPDSPIGQSHTKTRRPPVEWRFRRIVLCLVDSAISTVPVRTNAKKGQPDAPPTFCSDISTVQ
jgi:hypothetical protein